MLRIRTYGFIVLLMTLASTAFAQLEKVQQAYDYVTQSKLDSAKIMIDIAMNDPEAEKDFQSWYIKGFIYKEIYKQKEAGDFRSSARDIAIESLKKALELDAQKQQAASILQNLKFLGSKYKNDAIKNMDTINYDLSEQLFEKFVSTYKVCDPAFVEKTNRIEYYLAISYKFQEAFEQVNTEHTLELSKKYLQKALAIDSTSSTANKNYALLYYNMGVNVIKRMDYDVDLEQLYIFQDQATKLFQQALPYMSRAHEISPQDKTIVEGLQGIYYQLNDSEKSNEYKKKLEELNK